MRTSSRIWLVLFFGCLLMATSCILVQAEESQSEECVANEAGECINPDAEEEVVEDPVPAVEEPIVETEPDAIPEEVHQEIPVPNAEEQQQEETTEEVVVEEEVAVEEEAPVLEEEAPVVEEEAPPVVEEETETPPVEEEAEEVVSETPPVVEEKETPPAVTTTTKEEDNSAGCPSRSHVIACAAQYLDKNQNGALDRDELQGAIDSLPWWSRGVLSLLGSVDAMMKKCDMDGNDDISLDYDMKHNGKTCLATCFKRRAFKAAFFPDCVVDTI